MYTYHYFNNYLLSYKLQLYDGNEILILDIIKLVASYQYWIVLPGMYIKRTF